MDDILHEYYKKITDDNHYFKKSKELNHQYHKDFEAVYKLYFTNHSSECKKWLQDKMMLKSGKFNEVQFIQFACEATIVSFFTNKFHKNTKIDQKVNSHNNMDVDLVVKDGDYIYNIEVKCPDFENNSSVINKGAIKIQFMDRADDNSELYKSLNNLLQPVANSLETKEGVVWLKNLDNKLKDFLKSANSKFKNDANEKELNILSVSCDDEEDFQRWYCYLFDTKGLFTDQSFALPERFENIDILLLNNLYFRHKNYFDKKLNNSWSLNNSFCLILENPYAKSKKLDAIDNFLESCPNKNSEYQLFSKSERVKRIPWQRRIVHFIKEYEKKNNIYYFGIPDKV